MRPRGRLDTSLTEQRMEEILNYGSAISRIQSWTFVRQMSPPDMYIEIHVCHVIDRYDEFQVRLIHMGEYLLV